ncbi:hypothetical protein AGDE_16770 [Angomonas deanei]|nr:hypothetical protein AGDE_16770 [Angomonas deanei]|eukprot:EPY16241.1 hypothetical protein AGDE_16770 [Angomonas deanei]
MTSKQQSQLDDKELLYRLVKQAKSSHSNLGRSLDTDLSYRRMGGATVEPGVLSANRSEHLRQLAAQQQLQSAWETGGSLTIPRLGTIPPSFTQAADDGVVALGGTARVGAGFTTLVAAVPTETTVKCIDDNMELISSFRPYSYDARRAERESNTLDHAAPHPDLLQQLAPTLSSVSPSQLVDVGSLPSHLIPRRPTRTLQQPMEEVEEEEPPLEETPHQREIRSAPPGGTYSFTAVGRKTERPRLPGNRMPVIGQYQLRYNEVEPRVTHGYMMPPQTTTSRRVVEESPSSPVERKNSARTDVESLMGGTVHLTAATQPTRDLTQEFAPGENIKGSSMFLDKSQRGQTGGTAAPDVMYWPYPDVRSTTSRQPMYTFMDAPTTTRRRQPRASGVPAGAYEVAGDISKGLHNSAQMRSTTGRDQHYYGKREQYGGTGDWLDVDTALQATKPNPKGAVLPPQRSEEELRRERPPVDTSVSVERNWNYPSDGIGRRDDLQHVRRFDQSLSRDQRETAKSLNAHRTQAVDGYDVTYDPVEKRSTGAIIHARAPGHGTLHNPNPTELGETPNLKWTRPANDHATRFGPGSKRPDHLLPMNDLSYNTEPGYRLIEPRVPGDPHIGTVESRQSRQARAATGGNGADVMYNLNGTPPRGKLVPNFEKQITKETEFRGHNIQSERWERHNPKAPGPGSYNISYKQVDPDRREPRINTMEYMH